MGANKNAPHGDHLPGGNSGNRGLLRWSISIDSQHTVWNMQKIVPATTKFLLNATTSPQWTITQRTIWFFDNKFILIGLKNTAGETDCPPANIYAQRKFHGRIFVC